MKVGIAGFGTIGKPVAAALDEGIEGLKLVAICSRDRKKAVRNMEGRCAPVPDPSETRRGALKNKKSVKCVRLVFQRTTTASIILE